MATKKPAAKKPAKKRAARKKKAGGPVEVVSAPVSPSELTIEDVIAEREAYADRWAEAWRFHAIGVPLRTIGERMGISHEIARKYIRCHQLLMWGDPNLIEQRADMLARMDQIITEMARELTTLDAAERGKPVGERSPVWLSHGETLMRAIAKKWDMVSPEQRSTAGRVQVEVGVIPGSAPGSDRGGMRLPNEVAAVLAKVTVDDGDDDAEAA